MSLEQKYPNEVKQILSKYPPEHKRSAVMPLLYLAQREEGGRDHKGAGERRQRNLRADREQKIVGPMDDVEEAGGDPFHIACPRVRKPRPWPRGHLRRARLRTC